MRPGSTTENRPAQSARDVRSRAKRLRTSVGFGIGNRNSTIPQVGGKPEALASSPKS
jgi:hypothetical protein